MSPWFYVGLIFVLINLFFIVLFFFARATLYLEYKNGKFSYQAKICGIKTGISLRKKKHKHGERGKLVSTFKPRNDLTKLGNLVLEIIEVRKALEATAGKFFKKSRFEINNLDVILGGENATQSISYILEYLDNVARVDIPQNAHFSVKTDYINRVSSFETNVTIHVAFFRYVFWRYVLLDLNYND